MSMPQETVTNHQAACVTDSVGFMVAIVRCLTTPEEELNDSESMVEKSHCAMPKVKNYLDGEPTKADLRKYVTANLKHMLSLLEAK